MLPIQQGIELLSGYLVSQLQKSGYRAELLVLFCCFRTKTAINRLKITEKAPDTKVEFLYF